MTENPRVANENDNIIDWLRIMSNDRFRRLPVVDSDVKLKLYLHKEILYPTHGQISFFKLHKWQRQLFLKVFQYMVF